MDERLRVHEEKTPVVAQKTASAVLMHIEGAQGGLLRLFPGTYTLGRAQENALIVRDLASSRVHARIDVMQDGQIQVTDLESGNGTLLNGAMIDKAPLVAGDEITIGNTIYVVSAPNQADRFDEPLNQQDTGPSSRNDINAALEAVKSRPSSSPAPTHDAATITQAPPIKVPERTATGLKSARSLPPHQVKGAAPLGTALNEGTDTNQKQHLLTILLILATLLVVITAVWWFSSRKSEQSPRAAFDIPSELDEKKKKHLQPS